MDQGSDVEGCSLAFWSTGQLFLEITQVVTELRWQRVKSGMKTALSEVPRATDQSSS